MPPLTRTHSSAAHVTRGRPTSPLKKPRRRPASTPSATFSVPTKPTSKSAQHQHPLTNGSAHRKEPQTFSLLTVLAVLGACVFSAFYILLYTITIPSYLLQMAAATAAPTPPPPPPNLAEALHRWLAGVASEVTDGFGQ